MPVPDKSLVVAFKVSDLCRDNEAMHHGFESHKYPPLVFLAPAGFLGGGLSLGDMVHGGVVVLVGSSVVGGGVGYGGFPWRGLELGRHGGVVVLVGSTVVGGGVGYGVTMAVSVTALASASALLSSSSASVPPSSLSEMQALRRRLVALEDARSNSNQYHTPQLTFAAFVASRATIFGLEVERSGEVLEPEDPPQVGLGVYRRRHQSDRRCGE